MYCENVLYMTIFVEWPAIVMFVPVDFCLILNDVFHYSNARAMWKMSFYVNPTFLVPIAEYRDHMHI